HLMPAILTINGIETSAPAGTTLFACAESIGVRVPTSCQMQGKCKECMVEVSEGVECLSPRTEHERHLSGNYRLSCRTQIVADYGHVRCHTMRRGHMRIERETAGLSPARYEPDPVG